MLINDVINCLTVTIRDDLNDNKNSWSITTIIITKITVKIDLLIKEQLLVPTIFSL